MQYVLKLRQITYEMHTLAPINSTFAAIMIGLDYVINIFFICWVRFAAISKNKVDLFISYLQPELFLNKILFTEEVNFTINFVVIATFLIFAYLWLAADLKSQRKRSSTIILTLVSFLVFSINSWASFPIIFAQNIYILCP